MLQICLGYEDNKYQVKITLHQADSGVTCQTIHHGLVSSEIAAMTDCYEFGESHWYGAAEVYPCLLIPMNGTQYQLKRAGLAVTRVWAQTLIIAVSHCDCLLIKNILAQKDLERRWTLPSCHKPSERYSFYPQPSHISLNAKVVGHKNGI